jgi:hypothetical protein
VDQLTGAVAFVAHAVALPALITAPLIGSSAASRGTRCRPRIRDTVRAGTPSSAPIQSGPRRSRRRRSTTLASTPALVRVGIRNGREGRSRRLASPSARYRSIQVFTHFREIPIAAAI